MVLWFLALELISMRVSKDKARQFKSIQSIALLTVIIVCQLYSRCRGSLCVVITRVVAAFFRLLGVCHLPDVKAWYELLVKEAATCKLLLLLLALLGVCCLFLFNFLFLLLLEVGLLQLASLWEVVVEVLSFRLSKELFEDLLLGLVIIAVGFQGADDIDLLLLRLCLFFFLI